MGDGIMRMRSAWFAATILAGSVVTASAQTEPVTDLFCDPNPYVVAGFCDQITIFNQNYCQPCGIPAVEQIYTGGNTPPPDDTPDDDDSDDEEDDDTPRDDTGQDDTNPPS